MRGDLTLAPLALVFWIGIRIKMHRIQLHANEIPNAVRQLFGHRMGSYLCSLLFLVFLWPWLGLIFAIRFDWHRADVSEVEISTFPSPDPQIKAERAIRITDQQVLSHLFDSLESLQKYTSSHEHAVGKIYVLRLRRLSDGLWSNYRVAIYPDREALGGLHITGIYIVEIDYGSHWFNLGGDHQSLQLGRLVEELARRTP